MFKRIALAVVILGLCGCGPSYRDIEKKKEEAEKVEREKEDRLRTKIRKDFAKRLNITDLTAQDKLMKELQEGQFTSIEVEERLHNLLQNQDYIISHGCIKDIVSNPAPPETRIAPYIMLFGPCHEFFGNNFRYKLQTDLEQAKKALKYGTGMNNTYHVAIYPNRVAGIVDGNSYRKSYQIEGGCVDLIPTSGEASAEKAPTKDKVYMPDTDSNTAVPVDYE